MIGAEKKTGYRWTICALIFFAVTINYLDRSLFAQLVPFFKDELRLGPTDLALINVSFTLPYGFAMVFIGRWIDRVGIRRGLGGSYLLWNIASIGHAAVQSLGGFMGARFLLGLGESGMYPSGVKTVTEWFPVKERSTATGIFNAGANMGAIAAPLLGVWLATHFGWRTCFILTGALGLVWMLFWRTAYRPPREHPKVKPEELALIEGDPEEPVGAIGYAELFGMKPIYALAIAKALSDAPWWFYLFWLPQFFVDGFHVSKTVMSFALAFVYVIADVGSIAGGWLSSKLIAGGRSVGSARKTAMLVCALAVTPVIAVGYLSDTTVWAGVPGVYWAAILLAIAAGAHQGWSSNLFTVISDTVPKPAIAMAVGAINGFAMIGASAMQFFVGKAVAVTSSYQLPFLVAGTLYLIALVILHLMMPEIRQTQPTRKANLSLVAAGGVAVLVTLGVLQYLTNKPPYLSIKDYLKQRPAEVHSTSAPKLGAIAKVGWMNAQWYRWDTADGKPKIELVKLDTHDQVFIESKGTKAADYKGPSATEVAAGFGP